VNSDDGDGRPWGDGTEMAKRAKGAAPAGPQSPWDEKCKVTTYVSGLDAMNAMRNSLDLAAAEGRNAAPGQPKGRVYFTNWRFNAFRDLSTSNPWGTGATTAPWPSTDGWDNYVSGAQATDDFTALSLVLRLMQAGVVVRMLLWLPTAASEMDLTAALAAHVMDHFYVARAVEAESKRLAEDPNNRSIVALDMRTADSTDAGAHHQKTLVIRGALTSVAYVGGVDFAFTRRDAPKLQGDWQSGDGVPAPSRGWPHQSGPFMNYTKIDTIERPARKQASDLPTQVYGSTRQIWHDQHLRVEGPIVKTLEHQFKERWEDTIKDRRLFDLSSPSSRANYGKAQVIFSSADAFDANGIKSLPDPTPPPALTGATSKVQMWRTIPWRTTRKPGSGLFERAEFTVMAGIANAVKQSKELILIFDQYFWSRPFARLVNAQLKDNNKQDLHVIVVVPPHADTDTVLPLKSVAHRARANAFADLTADLPQTGIEFDRVAIYNTWLDRTAHDERNRGIYVHAKTQTYDGDLLVCGSANLNRRSFTCDSEINCAVLDPAVVVSHQTELWSYLFAEAPRPDINLSAYGQKNGKKFFDAFKAAVDGGSSILIRDPWRAADPTLPNGVKRDQSPWILGEERYAMFLDPSSITPTVEAKVFDVAGGRDARLDDIVGRLETYQIAGYWPYRRP
jgi:phosphatidylserine/phosphatidylglycerophosphate/cardiolipin synthase-like enzyme